jgi:hypothetical protein
MGMGMTESVYDVNAPLLRERGYYCHPIGPGSKRPAHFVPSTNQYAPIPGWNHERRPMETSPQPGAGIGLRTGLQPDGTHVVAIDWDNLNAAIEGMTEIPSPVSKEGSRGCTTFYRSQQPIPSRDFRVNGIVAVQILSDGRQTVLPPSLHPDTGKQYIWADKYNLYNCAASDLPLLPDDYIARIEKILRPLGYEPDEKANGQDHAADDDNPFQELNALALRDLAAWVPDLGLYNLKHQRGRFTSYVAVASFRPSTGGRPLEQRDLNLKISGKAIKDFGTGIGYSPINLVMTALGLARPDAMEWLQLRLKPAGPEIDFEALRQSAQSPQEDIIIPFPPNPNSNPNSQPKKRRFKFTAFDDMRPSTEPPYLIEEMLPVRGIVELWGKAKSLKSFFLLGAMLHVAKGWKFHGRAVQQGHVVYCAFEGGHGYSNRVEALRQEHHLDDCSEPTPFTIMRGGANLISEHRQLIAEIRDVTGGAKLVAVVLDTLNRSLHGSESKDLDMAAYIRAAEAIRDAFDCVVIIAHHCGWDESRGRGHSSLPGAVDAELSAMREGDVVAITVEEMRDGPDGGRIIGRTKSVVVGYEDATGKEITSLVIVPADDEEPIRSPEARQWPASLKIFDHKIPDGPTVKAVDLKEARKAFYQCYAVESESDDVGVLQESKRKAFGRALQRAQELHLIAAYANEWRQIIWLVTPFESHA